MPCTPRMSNCRLSCRHRTMVLEYRAARAAAEAERESATSMYPTELAEHPPLLTFRDWLVQMSSTR